LIAYFGRAILEFLNPEYLAVHVALLVLVAFGLARSIANCLSPVMLALGKPKWLFTISTAQLVLIAGCLALLPSRLGVGGVAICVAGAAWFVVGCLSLVVARELQISSWALIGSFALASVCSGVGIVAAYLISGIPCPNKVASCVLEGTAFILCYLITTILVWRTAHRRGYAEMVERVQDPERDAGPLL
jgi:O-antigen/teichoic acid export membrane protein